MQILHKYPDKNVLLSVGLVDIDDDQFQMIEAKENQPIQWVEQAQITEYDFPEANKPILLNLPAFFQRLAN